MLCHDRQQRGLEAFVQSLRLSLNNHQVSDGPVFEGHDEADECTDQPAERRDAQQDGHDQ